MNDSYFRIAGICVLAGIFLWLASLIIQGSTFMIGLVALGILGLFFVMYLPRI